MTTTTLTRQRSKRTFKSFFPIIEWLPKYNGSYLRPDSIAALTVWALLVPEAMAYAGMNPSTSGHLTKLWKKPKFGLLRGKQVMNHK